MQIRAVFAVVLIAGSTVVQGLPVDQNKSKGDNSRTVATKLSNVVVAALEALKAEGPRGTNIPGVELPAHAATSHLKPVPSSSDPQGVTDVTTRAKKVRRRGMERRSRFMLDAELQ